MATENPKNLYDQVCENISQITGRGLLYQTIGIIMGEEQLLYREKTSKICDYFGIKPSANKDEDKKIINNLLDGILKNTPINNVIAKAINQGGNMEWIFVAAAFTFVGLFFYKQTLDKKEQEKIKPTIAPGTQYKPTFQPLIPADLCLVVPASIASNFINRSNLKVDELIYLIDNASYFLCTSVKVADANEQNLEITDDNISSDSIREVYIRININDGRNMINQDVRFSLKNNLPSQADCTVKKLACLGNLSGLEKFNRI
ncbi:hypothetical protein FJR41_012745 [Dolichospermum planctonicum UHCC 0167]|uniref:hypothetical protein n=1 Tax=Dolichospermum planctonicum TaxID=136072 RepID=UPI0014435EAF|nr:hypothetical protein [Dolichospermum planctonicum]MCW9681649.1 hypothetical protein [Dolichospermum planctonicum UHCC 0167]